ncbi:MAG: LUD domain-containing protein [Candidatus Helarchaeales archaeon]
MTNPIEQGKELIDKGIEQMPSSLKTFFNIGFEKKILNNQRPARYSEEYNKIKDESIERNDELLELFKQNAESKKFNVFIAETEKDALDYVFNLVKDEKYVVKSKSNTAKEIRLSKYLEDNGIEVIETDLGDRIIQILDETPSLPVGPAAHVPATRIAQAFSEYYGVEIPPLPQEIVKAGKKELREKMINARIGITGANVLVAEDGRVGLIENEGNISLITRLSEIHIVIVGIDKIVPTWKDAITVLQMAEAAIDLNGTYVSFINGPSQTSDIQGVNVYGMSGAQEVHLILVKGYRRIAKERGGFKSLLKCINCGACYLACPLIQMAGLDVYKSEVATSPVGVIKAALILGIEEAIKIGLFACTSCGRCKEVCPGNVDIPGMIKLLRQDAMERGFKAPEDAEVIESIMIHDNPFGRKESKPSLQ